MITSFPSNIYVKEFFYIFKAFMHISTAYSNCDIFHIKEKLYPAKADWKKLITVAETCDKLTLSVVTQIYMNNMENTYVFTKQVAESVINDMLLGKIPTNIFRPSVGMFKYTILTKKQHNIHYIALIVICSIREPMKGWVDNLNGPAAIAVGYGKGI